MNKNLHRVIFNETRHAPTVVAENARSHRSGGRRGRHAGRSRGTACLRTLSFCLFAVFGALAWLAPDSAQARIVADRNAPGNQQPTILEAANGVPVVNIQTPSKAGVSRNVYSRFDVDQQGAILNNARTNAQTQQAGWVEGNPWLAKGSARVILNEVNASDPSQLRGYVEVAGARAEVVIANPAGISCSGCGFINAHSATLTTGQPIVQSGRLDGYRVSQGTVVIEGDGFDASTADHASIIARAAEINAGVWAGELDVITGANRVDARSGKTSAIAGNGAKPEFSIDVAALGGMYAGRIRLVGTEAGVGVRNAGQIAATAGSLVVTADGRLENNGYMGASGTLYASAARGIDNNGVVHSDGHARLDTTGDIDNRGTVATQGDLTLTANRILSNTDATLAAGIDHDGRVNGSGSLQATATESIAAHGLNLAAGRQHMQAQSVDLSGSHTHADEIELVATAGDADLSGARIESVTRLAVRASDALITDDALVTSGQLALAARDLSNVKGEILQTGEGTAEITADTVDNTRGVLASRGNIQLDTDRLTNISGTILADAALTLASNGTVDNTDGLIAAGATLDMHDPHGARNLAVTNTDGTLLAGHLLSLDGAGLAGNGSLLSHGDIALTLANDYIHGGTLHAAGNVTLDTAGALENQGRIAAGGSLELGASDLTNADNAEVSATDLHLAADGRLVNRGLIDGNTALLEASTLDNLGPGRIHGDHLAIAVTTLNNLGENHQAPVIAARERLDIGVDTVHNRDNALIFSAGDMTIGGELDDSRHAIGRATLVDNASADIEALGHLHLAVDALRNADDHFATAFIETDATSITEFQRARHAQRYAPDEVSTYLGRPNSDQIVLYLQTPQGSTNDWYRYDYTRRTEETVILDSRPGTLSAGGNLHIEADSVLNDKSRILAGGALDLHADELRNVDVEGQRVVTDRGTVTHYYRIRRSQGGISQPQGEDTTSYRPAPLVETFTLSAAQVAAGSTHSASGAVIGAFTLAPLEQTTPEAGALVRSGGFSLQLPGNRLFRTHPDANAGYLIETDTRFADYRTWLSSDYMLDRLGLDPAGIHKRLGDGFYEQRLIREQIAQLTGQRLLAGHANDEDQFRALLDAGITFAEAWDLIPGVALSPEQMAALTTDIVWLVEHTVTLPDGSTPSVLVPQVYVRVHEGDLDGSGALIAARELSLDIVGDAFNQGRMLALDTASIQAANLHNTGGSVFGRELEIGVRRDLINTGGDIGAVERLDLHTGRDLHLAGATYQSEGDNGTRNGVSRLASVYVTGADASLVASAGRDFTATASEIRNLGGGETAILAARDIRLDTLDDTRTETIASSAYHQRTESETRQIGTRIVTTGDLAMLAGRDLAARGADIHGDALHVAAERDIVFSAAERRVGVAIDATDRVSGRVATWRLEQAHVEGNALTGQDITLVAGRDQTHAATRVTAGDSTTLAAGRDLTLSTATATDSRDAQRGDGRNWHTTQATLEVGTSIDAAGDVTLLAGQDLTARATHVTSADGALTAAAGRDLSIEAGRQTHELDAATYKRSRGLLSTTTRTTRTTEAHSTTEASAFSADAINMMAGQDLAITASHVVATGDVGLAAGRDLLISADEEQHAYSHAARTRTSGVFSGGGASFTIGSQRLSQDQATVSAYAAPATVGSLEGDVTLTAGRNVEQIGSDVLALQGDIAIAAERVDIAEARETQRSTQETRFRQSGLTVAISNPVISAAQTAQQMGKAAGNTSDPRMQALAAASSGLAGYNANQAVQEAPGLAGGVGLSVTLGSSKSSSQSTATSNVATGSNVVAGGNVTILAGGAGENSDITVRGSRISAGENLTLAAEDEIRLLAARNTRTLDSSNRSSSAGIGVAITVGGPDGAAFGITANASRARGKADGTDQVWSNTHITAGDTLTLLSGGDTTLHGAVANGEQIIAAIGGDLTIESLQDTSTYTSRNKGAGGSLTVGAGVAGSVSFSKGSIDSDFASVAEQSAIRAGDGGFQVGVHGDTTLAGGAITSTQQAIDDNLNHFETGGELTLTDIVNRATYKGKSVSVSAGAGYSSGGKETGATANAMPISDTPFGSAGVGSESGSENSMTLASISGIAGHTEARTGDAETGLKPIFDANKVQREIDAQMAITAAFGQHASKAIGDYASARMDKANALKAQAANESDPTRRAELEAQAAAIESQWGDQGTLRLAAHTLVGGLTGGAAGVAGAAVGTLSAPAVADALREAGIDGPLASVLTGLASTAAGAVVGGTAGGAAAFNEVANNYLTHRQIEEKQKRLAEAQSEEERQSVLQEYDELYAAQRGSATACLVSGKCDSIMLAMGIKAEFEALLGSCAPPRICSADQQRSINELQMIYAAAEAISPAYPLETLVAMLYTGGTLSLGRGATGAGIGGGFDAAGQAYQLYTGNQEEYRLMQTAFASLTGMVAAPYASTSILGNAALGGGVGASNAALNNWWYGEDASVGTAAFNGFLFSMVGTAAGQQVNSTLRTVLPSRIGGNPIDPSVPILLQNVGKPNHYPDYIGSTVEQLLANTPHFIKTNSEDGK